VALRRGLSVNYSAGCGLNASAADNATAIASASAAMEHASFVVLFLGLCGNNRQGPDGSAGCLDGIRPQETEGDDRYTLDLPGAQQALLERALEATKGPGKKLVVVLVTGGSLAVEALKDSHAAVVYAPYGGQSAGDAIVDVLFGRYSPEGKSPITWYPSSFVNTRASWEMDLRAGDGVTHLYYRGKPLWAFGTGLSYTRFRYVHSYVRIVLACR
jgi:beta-glucosidase